MKVLSLFDGISCARVALERAGFPVEFYFSSEIDTYANSISKKNYPEIIQIGDIKDINFIDGVFSFRDGRSLGCGEIDLFIGGSPCQDLSVAKKNRKGLDGERSGLFWDYVRLLKLVKPKYFILENVNSMPKEAKRIITETLGVEPIMINASLVSAQNRKRLFWTNISNVVQPTDKGILLRDILEENVDEKYFIKDVSLIKGGTAKKTDLNFIGGVRNKDWAKDGKNYSRNFGQGDRVYSADGKSTTLSALGGGRGAKTGLYHIPHGYKKEEITLEDKYPTLCGQDPRTKHLLCISSTQEHATISENKSTPLNAAMGMGGGHTPMITEDFLKVRKLTPIECERLQGLPDNYTAGVSNSQRYKMLGNAFNVDVVAHILSFIPSNPLF